MVRIVTMFATLEAQDLGQVSPARKRARMYLVLQRTDVGLNALVLFVGGEREPVFVVQPERRFGQETRSGHVRDACRRRGRFGNRLESGMAERAFVAFGAEPSQVRLANGSPRMLECAVGTYHPYVSSRTHSRTRGATYHFDRNLSCTEDIRVCAFLR